MQEQLNHGRRTINPFHSNDLISIYNTAAAFSIQFPFANEWKNRSVHPDFP